MLKRLLNNRMMFPEPEATGGGDASPAVAPQGDSTPAETTQDAPAQETQVNEEANPFDFDADDGSEDEENPKDVENSLTEQDGYSTEQLDVINEISDKYGLDKDTRAGLFRDFIERAQKLDEAEAVTKNKQATEALRQKWGKDFDGNVKDAGRFISRMGKALGWPQEYIDSWKNPEDMMLAHQIYRYFGERGLKGVGEQSAAAPQPNVPAKADAPSALRSLVAEYQRARFGSDRNKMREMSNEHLRINSIVYGDTTRHLPLP